MMSFERRVLLLSIYYCVLSSFYCSFFFFTVDKRSLLAKLKDFVASQRLLTIILIHIVYAIPPNWPRGTNWQRIPNYSMTASIIIAVFIWMAFGMEMHITRLLWTQAHADNQHPPIGSVMLVVLLVLSSTVSFTIMTISLIHATDSITLPLN